MRTIIICNMFDSLLLASKDASAAGSPTAPTTTTNSLRIKSAELLGLHREAIILHGGREYRLRVTQNGRLILTA